MSLLALVSQSFIFSKCFILLRVKMDVEPILRTLGMEYARGRNMPVHRRAPHARTHTHICLQLGVTSSPTNLFFGIYEVAMLAAAHHHNPGPLLSFKI